MHDPAGILQPDAWSCPILTSEGGESDPSPGRVFEGQCRPYGYPVKSRSDLVLLGRSCLHCWHEPALRNVGPRPTRLRARSTSSTSKRSKQCHG
jgi:hypothetical protein